MVNLYALFEGFGAFVPCFWESIDMACLGFLEFSSAMVWGQQEAFVPCFWESIDMACLGFLEFSSAMVWGQQEAFVPCIRIDFETDNLVFL